MADKKTTKKFSVKVPKIDGSKTYTISLSLPGMISAVGAGVLALTFFFVMGILIGRGYRPEADVPQLDQIMPKKEHGEIAGEPVQPEILKAEELEYADRLKTDPDKIMDQPPEEEEKKTAPKPEQKQAEAAQPVAEPEAQPKAQPEPAKPGEPVFDYVYQAASFRKVEMARSLATKLEASGLRSRVQAGDVNGSTWHRVQVLHHGTPDSTASMKAVLAKFGIDKPLLKKKTPAR